MSRNPSVTPGGNHAAHSEEIRISPQISGANNSPTFSLSGLNFAILIWISPNSHLDFSQFSFGFLRTQAVCNFPCSHFSASSKGLKKLGLTIEWHAVIQLSEATKVSIYRQCLVSSVGHGLNVPPAGRVGGTQIGETFVDDAL